MFLIKNILIISRNYKIIRNCLRSIHKAFCQLIISNILKNRINTNKIKIYYNNFFK